MRPEPNQLCSNKEIVSSLIPSHRDLMNRAAKVPSVLDIFYFFSYYMHRK